MSNDFHIMKARTNAATRGASPVEVQIHVDRMHFYNDDAIATYHGFDIYKSAISRTDIVAVPLSKSPHSIMSGGIDAILQEIRELEPVWTIKNRHGLLGPRFIATCYGHTVYADSYSELGRKMEEVTA